MVRKVRLCYDELQHVTALYVTVRLSSILYLLESLSVNNIVS